MYFWKTIFQPRLVMCRHNLPLSMQATIHSTPQTRTSRNIWNVVYNCYCLIFLCYVCFLSLFLSFFYTFSGVFTKKKFNAHWMRIESAKTRKVLVVETFCYTVFSQKGDSMEPMEPPLDPPLSSDWITKPLASGHEHLIRLLIGYMREEICVYYSLECFTIFTSTFSS